MWELTKKLLVIVLSLSLASTGLAASDGKESILNPFTENEGSKIDALGLTKPDIATFSTQIPYEGKTLTLDVTRGQVLGREISSVVKMFRMMEPELRKVHELDPQTKIRFYHITDNSNYTYLTASEILSFLKDINSGTYSETVRVDSSVAERLKHSIASIFDQTSKSDIYWGLARLGGGGTSSVFSFYVSDLPLPVALIVGLGTSGAGSAGIGVMIEKFTGWLDNNAIDPAKKIRNRLGSIETYMFLSPVLIPLTSQHVNNIESAALIAGTAAASVIVQNVYHTIRKISPNSAMWYKWYATEVLFVTTPSVVLNWLGHGASNLTSTVMTMYLAGLMTTVSQGVWDIFITKMRKPFLEAAIAKDLAEYAERFNGKSVLSIRAEQMANISSMDQLLSVVEGKDVSKMSDSQYKAIAHKFENQVRERFKKYYYFASAWSVASAMTMTAGANAGNAALTQAGTLGLVVLGVSGFFTWMFVSYKKRKAARTNAKSEIMATPINACKRTF